MSDDLTAREEEIERIQDEEEAILIDLIGGGNPGVPRKRQFLPARIHLGR